MHLHFSAREIAALRLASTLADYPDIETFVRDAAMEAVHRTFDDGVAVIPVEQPVRGRDILSIAGDD